MSRQTHLWKEPAEGSLELRSLSSLPPVATGRRDLETSRMWRGGKEEERKREGEKGRERGRGRGET